MKASAGVKGLRAVEEQFALFGAAPVFPEPLHVGRPNIGNHQRLHDRLEDILQRRHLTNMGPMVREFEERLADLVGVNACVALTNATIALEIITRVLGMKEEVIVPSMTFVATAHALQWQQITPVFADIAAGSHHLDATRIQSMITPRTSGLVPVNLWGKACDIDSILDVAGGYELPVVFDSAHALGCTYKGKMLGGFGNAEVFSFHATKFLNAFEGGAITTNDDSLAREIRLCQNFGFEGRDRVTQVGTNGKMSEVQAAMGLTSLEHFDEFVEWNARNYWAYRAGIAAIPGVTLVEYDDSERSNYQYIVIEVDEGLCGLSRDDMVRILAAENIDVRRYFYPGCHRMEPYRSYFPNAGLMLPRTEATLEKVIALPTGTAVTVEDVANITGTIERVVEHSASVRSRLYQGPGQHAGYRRKEVS